MHYQHSLMFEQYFGIDSEYLEAAEQEV